MTVKIMESQVQIPEGLLRREKARQDEEERRANERGRVRRDDTDWFLSSFSSQRVSIEEQLALCATKQDLEEVTIRTQQLQRLVNDSVAFLPQYDLRQAQVALQTLQTSLAEKRDKLLPPRKFAFRSRSAVSKPTPGPTPSPAPTPTPAEPTASSSSSDSVRVDGVVNPDQCGFSQADGQTLTKSGREIEKQDVLLTHLSGCKVRLLGAPSTLHIKHVRDCEILCGPVSSSVFIDHCTNCTLAFACQQLRTHNTTDTQVYLHVTSRAIIEDCQGVGFAPFSWSYPGLDEDFSLSGLDRNQNNWTQVDDFNWLAAGTPSPNWMVIPEARPGHIHFEQLPSKKYSRTIWARTNRLKFSFFPRALQALNKRTFQFLQEMLLSM